ncbi:MAG: YbaB/EbfC family nucleoid-associated protein [Deltaproteobacteria bacterium]|nr:YbaB/EbfC family nucleoid-associated protein [Deltaproteobacteria bacterium]
MSKGGFGGGFGNLVKQAQQMQLRIQKLQEEMADKTAEGSAGAGAIVVVANGKQQIVSVKISKDVVSEDVDMLQDLVLEATNQALKKSSEMVSEAMKAVTGGLSVPGMF